MLWKFFDVSCIVEYAFKVTAKNIFITYNAYLLIIILNIDSAVWKIEDGKKKTEIYWTMDWI